MGACERPQEYEKPRPAKIYVPEELRQCPGLPRVPASVNRQSEVARYIIALHEVAKTCKTHLGKVDDILDDYEARLQDE